MTTLDEIGVYCDMFINGFRVPLHPFFIRVLKVYRLVPGQFSPHAWSFMSFFIYQCHKLGLNPRVRVFSSANAASFFLSSLKILPTRQMKKKRKRAKKILVKLLPNLEFV
ncbi:hypothetical protein RJ639_002160 [Escallonia herrerae]|uniref:Transposase (putative) gypsy type domain-containing protein n=1 Tax=Escallonia herrerae TaxID=1293975 RepID=A0AA88XBC3_9ASTE|nr:hypothetical protein RJ639_002160 [Escallonia herrerae]